MVPSKIIFPGGQGIPHSIIILRVMVLCIAKTVLSLEDPMKGMSISSINDLNEEKRLLIVKSHVLPSIQIKKYDQNGKCIVKKE